MRNLGFKTTGVVVDFEVGDTIVVMSGRMEGYRGHRYDRQTNSRQSLTINVEMFGRETPVELNFSESEENVGCARLRRCTSGRGNRDITT